MKFNTISVPVRVLNVGFDVSGDRLDFAYEVLDQSVTGHCENRTLDIDRQLKAILASASKAGFGEVRVICESTGIYHRNLLQVARRIGMRTNLVHGEAVSKYRTVQFHDHGKTDARDSQAILTVAKVGRLIKDRVFDSEYAQLRELHSLIMRLERRRRAVKNELGAELRCLIPDLRISESVLFGPTGRALFRLFGVNPLKITGSGREAFDREMKSESPRTKTSTLDQIWSEAKSSCCQQLDACVSSIREDGVGDLYAEILEINRKTEGFELRMQDIYRSLCQSNPHLPSPVKGVMSIRLLSRLVAETGPPEDFQTLSQLTRYAGLNLCERQSGKKKGQTTISRRGRSEIRYVLNLIALPLVRRRCLFGNYYWKKRDIDKMPGKKAMVCTMRKILKMFYGLTRDSQSFEADRVFTRQNSRPKKVSAKAS